MRKVTAHLFASTDGVVESPNLFQFDRFGPEEGEAMGKALAPVTDVILGRKLYEEWAGYFSGNDEDFGAFINPVRKHVATRTLSGPLEWNNSTLIEGDYLDFLRDLRDGEGGDIALNGISVIQEALRAGLVDALTLTVHPVLVGQGRRIFDGLDEPFRLELIDSQITSVGNAMLTYRKFD